ncbi:MAG: hypothetical protein F9K16_01375 [Thermoanaerobaculia bacterium]|nr:MAG: hypothetical protein F9K16_01375 [Thermoanaerobaculia bacterium]MBZ0102149.1 restriction endonuclease subunit S [Thermoanaerobaculia bacterium]
MTVARASAAGAPWLGTLQADWPLVPLRYLVSFLSGGTPDKGNPQFWSGGTIPWVSPKDMKIDRIDDAEDHITEAALGGSATQLVPVGSVLVVVRGMILAHTLPAAVTTGPVAINQDIKALVCGPRLLPDFLHAVLVGQAEWLLSLADSSAHGTKKLETEVLQRFEVPCPPLEVQRRIVETLQARATSLDVLATAKQRVIDLLAEKRRAIIATAVARGLDPKVKLHESGLPWLGKIPAHWATCHLRRLLASMDYGTSQTVEPEGRIPVLRMGDLRDGELDFSRIGYVEAISDDLLLRPGDLLFNRTNSLDQIGKVAKFRGHESEVSFASYLVRLRVNEHADSEFLNYLLNSAYVLARARAEALPAIGQANLNPNRYSQIAVAIPPIREQHAIVEHIAHQTARLDAVRAATQRTISLLKERRAALIAAAVTGHIDEGATA